MRKSMGDVTVPPFVPSTHASLYLAQEKERLKAVVEMAGEADRARIVFERDMLHACASYDLYLKGIFKASYLAERDHMNTKVSACGCGVWQSPIVNSPLNVFLPRQYGSDGLEIDLEGTFHAIRSRHQKVGS